MHRCPNFHCNGKLFLKIFCLELGDSWTSAHHIAIRLCCWKTLYMLLGSSASAEGPRDAPWQRRRHVTDLVHVKLPVNVHLSTVHKVITGAIAYWRMTFDL